MKQYMFVEMLNTEVQVKLTNLAKDGWIVENFGLRGQMYFALLSK